MNDQNYTSEQYLSLVQAARLRGVSPDYLRFLIFKKKLNAVKFGRNWVTTTVWMNDFFLKSDGRKTKKIFKESPLDKTNVIVPLVAKDTQKTVGSDSTASFMFGEREALYKLVGWDKIKIIRSKKNIILKTLQKAIILISVAFTLFSAVSLVGKMVLERHLGENLRLAAEVLTSSDRGDVIEDHSKQLSWILVTMEEFIAQGAEEVSEKIIKLLTRQLLVYQNWGALVLSEVKYIFDQLRRMPTDTAKGIYHEFSYIFSSAQDELFYRIKE